MAESDFDKELRNRLSGLEAAVDDGAWDSIEKALPPANNPWPVLGILAILLLAGIAGYFTITAETVTADENTAPVSDTRQL